MRFAKLRLSGFKSFVDPTELLIEPGMTGVVGPNGCGKSNLVEALRWVMGETSPKQMRGGAMDDVIFNGTQSRPSRNLAEVSLTIENSERTAPAAFNDGDELVVVRRIEREAGSIYRINGKEVRARDVQLLFADAATGAHSPALVSQGRVGALIGAKPTDRRALLEEAAGITGLHSRRHEAELRLRGAEANLERLQDVMTALEGQLQQVKRQARQAQRYRRLGEQIRRCEAIALHLRWVQAQAAAEAAEARLKEAEAQVVELTSRAAHAATAHAEAAERLPALRQAEAEAGARLHRLAVARDALEAEAKAAAERAERLEARIAQTDADASRERALAADAAAAAERLAREAETLEAAQAGEGAAAAEAQARVEAASAAVTGEERELEALTEWIAAGAARRSALGGQVDEANGRIQRLSARAAEAERERAGLEAQLAADDRVRAAQEALSAAEAEAAAAAEALERAEAARAEAERRAAEARELFQAGESEAAKLAAEDKALSQLLAAHEGDLFPPLIDALDVEPGFERALGAALGDELERPVDEAAPVHWATLPPYAEPPALPAGAEPLARRVKAPPALARRLSQIGVVDAADGPRLRPELKPGQRLVTREGALWRWDGFTIGAGAETPAAVRLAQRNRLADLRAERARADARFGELRARFDEARAQRDEALRAANAAREAAREAERRLSSARNARAEAERQAAARASRLGALAELLAQLEAELREARAAHEEAARSLAEQPALEPARERQAGLRQRVAELRAQLAEARAAEAQIRREAQMRAERRAAIETERQAWSRRAEGAAARLEELSTRRQEAADELAQARAVPGEIEARRIALLEQIAAAEGLRREAADALAQAEASVAELERTLKQSERAHADAREDRVRAEGGLEQARERLAELARRIREALDCAPEAALGAGGVGAEEQMPPLEEAEARFERLRRERDGMGPVNLRAEQEAQELEQQLDMMRAERADLEAAIARLRQGISSLNREGRERLLAAFKQVDEHFQQLFVRLFGGGKAHLALTEAEDPLEAGLEIMASPPGKRLQVLSLLSGGEQALTALALIFAVFLTNPAPICVLDEVDAPLDDANVERFCNLVAEIARTTGTRFLCITHHAFSMAKMDRLYGVTMAERGVSQLVSVDLARAERLRATA